MRTRKLLSNLLLSLIFAALLTTCGGVTPMEIPPPATATEMVATEVLPTEPTAAPTQPMDILIKAAQTEGTLTTIALPHDWCNYGEVIDTFRFKYGLEVNELNPDAGSGDEVEAIKVSKDNKDLQAPDVIDLEFAFGSSLKQENLIQPYKVSTWSTIPENAKDPEGYWYGGYYWVLAFFVNAGFQPVVPQDWADLLDPRYRGQVALSGDPGTSSQGAQSVLAAALANGSSLNDAWPGLDYFAKLNGAGNLVPVISNNNLFVTGQTPIRITWDYSALTAMESFQGNPKAEIVIPTSGRLANMFVQAISAYAPHPNAAKLWMEFLYSDEGQLLWMKGHCHPIREADLRARRVIPPDLLAGMPEASGVVFPTVEQLEAARVLISSKWDAVVGADIQPAP